MSEESRFLNCFRRFEMPTEQGLGGSVAQNSDFRSSQYIDDLEINRNLYQAVSHNFRSKCIVFTTSISTKVRVAASLDTSQSRLDEKTVTLSSLPLRSQKLVRKTWEQSIDFSCFFAFFGGCIFVHRTARYPLGRPVPHAQFPKSNKRTKAECNIIIVLDAKIVGKKLSVPDSITVPKAKILKKNKRPGRLFDTPEYEWRRLEGCCFV